MTAKRVLIFHGYLLSGTGSNIYNANLARTMAKLGHDVHLLCQERELEGLDFIDSVGQWRDGELSVSRLRDPIYRGRCTIYTPAIGRQLPVYVADSYKGFDAKTFDLLTDVELDNYLEANISAVRDVAAMGGFDLALANHLVMGPVILARALEGKLPYAVKVHGSALEYTVRPNPRFLPYATEGLAQATNILVGSDHVGQRLIEVVGNGDLKKRLLLSPPGVDVDRFTPRTAKQAKAALERLSGPSELKQLDPGRDRVCVFVGKLIVSKGVELLLAAWPLVRGSQPDAKLLIVGFGEYEEGLKNLLASLDSGDIETVTQITESGRELEGGERGRLDQLHKFLQSMGRDELERYFKAASDMARTVSFLGRYDHDQLADLLPACEVMAVPSTFPEAFGMVAAEAAACGVWSVVAGHSGLAEVAATLAQGMSPEEAKLLSFQIEENAVRGLADRLKGWFALPAQQRSKLKAAVRKTAAVNWSWEGTASVVIDAACLDQ